MGALTLGLILPAGPLADAGTHARAELPWMPAERRAAIDIQAAAEGLGIRCAIVEIPVHSARTELDLASVAELLGSRCAGFDRVLVVAHGQLGGSGLLHAAARAAGLPMAGPGERAIARAYDKLSARQRLELANLPVPRTVALDGSTPDTEALDRLGWPCVVKPRRGAAGAGVRRVAGLDELQAAVTQASRIDAELLVEREVAGRELSVVLIDGEVIGTAEIERRFSTSLTLDGATSMICPAQLSRPQRAGIDNLARRAALALGLDRGPVRVDVLVSERDNEVILEVEPLPPLDRDGVVARVARAAGLPYPRLIAALLATELPAHAPLPALPAQVASLH